MVFDKQLRKAKIYAKLYPIWSEKSGINCICLAMAWKKNWTQKLKKNNLVIITAGLLAHENVFVTQ